MSKTLNIDQKLKWKNQFKTINTNITISMIPK